MTTSIDNDGELSQLLDPDTLDQLRAAHPGAFYFIAEGDEGPVPVVFRRLKTPELQRVQEMLKNPRRAAQAGRQATDDVVLYPPKGSDALERLREDCPMLDDKIGALAVEIAKGQVPEEAKKLRTSPGKPRVETSPSTPGR